MARIRSIKPEFWTDGKVVSLPYAARLLFMGAWNFARCDQGHLDDDAVALKLKVLPADDVDPNELLEALVSSGLINRHTADGRTFLHIHRFTEHQKVETRWNSRCPYCPLHNSTELAQSPPTTLQEGKGGEGIGEERKEEPTSPPVEAPDVFDEFWETYPRRNGKRLHKGKAQSAWKRLSNVERVRAQTGVVHYRSACDRSLTLAADAFRWLRDKSFDDWQTPAQESANGHKPYSNADEWTPAERGLA